MQESCENRVQANIWEEAFSNNFSKKERFLAKIVLELWEIHTEIDQSDS